MADIPGENGLVGGTGWDVTKAINKGFMTNERQKWISGSEIVGSGYSHRCDPKDRSRDAKAWEEEIVLVVHLTLPLFLNP